MAKRRKKNEAYSPSGVVGMAVLVPLLVGGAAYCVWAIYSTFIIGGVGLLDIVTQARAPMPGWMALVVGVVATVVLLQLAWQGGSWLYRVAKGQVPRATEAQRKGIKSWEQ